jgi:DNA-binding CsgD family transcriptional regulator
MKETPSLAPQETAVLSHLSDGLSIGEIAEQLGVAEPSVKTFVAQAAKKLEARSQVHAVALAVRRRLI